MSSESEKDRVNRREFLIRSAKAGIAVAAVGALGYVLYDAKGPGPSSQTDVASLVLPDFSIPALGKKLAVVTGQDRVKSVGAALKALGGIEAFIKRGDRVLIKVNAAFATPAILCATTNPQLLAEVVRLCMLAGAASVVVTDNPINDPESCFALTGIGEAARSAGANVVLPREGLFANASAPGGVFIKDWPVLTGAFRGIDKVVGISPVKDHHRSGASMSLKNWYGIVGGRRNIFHQNIHEFIAELSVLVKPTLVILDGVTTMMTNGPTGGSLSDLKQTDTLIAGTDPVAVDAFGAGLLGRSVYDLPFLAKAEARGSGTVDFESLNPVRISV